MLVVVFIIDFAMTVWVKSQPFADPGMRRIIGILSFLLGMHILFFLRRWAEDYTLQWTKSLENKPGILQKGLSEYTSYERNRNVLIPIALFASILGALFFFWG